MCAANASLPESLYAADGVRALDRCVIDDFGTPGFELMQRAARSAFRQLARHWPDARQVLVLCGAGNNGGDGYLVAASARRQGLSVRCLAVADPARLKGDAATAHESAREAGVAIERYDGSSPALLGDALAEADVVVDAMLGTGITGALRSPFDQAIAAVRESARPVLAIDVPSGLDATTGWIETDAVSAAVTVTFIGLKTGLLTGQGPDVAGEVVFDDLGVDPATYDRVPAVACRADWNTEARHVPVRRRGAHKGDCGRLLVIAGERGFGGAALLAAEAAARTGAGLVTLATRPEHVSAALSRCPSLMVHGLTHGNELDALLAKADGIVFGPGAGQGAWGQQMLQRVMAFEGPVLMDADALNMLSSRAPGKHDNWILTPHPGEAARLLGVANDRVSRDRMDAIAQLEQRYGGVVLLKGAGTLVLSGNMARPALVQGGNPGMATGGMGDVLSGIIGSLAVQGLSPSRAAVMGASLHAEAADRASLEKGFMGLLPMDLIDRLPSVLGEVEGVRRPPGDQ
ncbi:NAD(P)H-hydrate dehydratase [Marinobacter halodurans]|uniref:Bifunctional NAD(P)H-hydrate repair enzyme n=1 Tax=Marinobacter halodurans TaxID=2528979 RepID=A0ABY1ZNY1_9GAMM|nr:NAD(P)H-hydrate dehydratase [Marinobacter halodurans]TBW56867.1 NAD(P)H-hydrate dehydratase [Marinobacter halodurans]